MVVGAALSGCGGRSATDEILKSANSRCPIPVENVGFVSSITLCGDTLVYTCNVTEPGVNVDGLASRADAVKRILRPMLPGLFTADARLLDELRDKGWTLSIRYVDGAGKRCDLNYAATELTERALGESPSPEQRLADEVDVANASLPARMAPAITMERVVDEGGMVTYICIVDEKTAQISNLDNLRASAPAIRSEMARSFLSHGDADVDRLVDITVAAGRGIRYLYRGSESGDTMSIAFSKGELVRPD